MEKISAASFCRRRQCVESIGQEIPMVAFQSKSQLITVRMCQADCVGRKLRGVKTDHSESQQESQQVKTDCHDNLLKSEVHFKVSQFCKTTTKFSVSGDDDKDDYDSYIIGAVCRLRQPACLPLPHSPAIH